MGIMSSPTRPEENQRLAIFSMHQPHRCPPDPQGSQLTLSHQKRQHQLPAGTGLPRRDRRNRIDEVEILGKILRTEPRREPPEIALLEVLKPSILPRQEPPPQRTIRHGRDPQLPTRLQQADARVLDIHRKGRVLDLDGGDMMDFTGAAEGFGRALAQAQEADLAGGFQLDHGRHGRLDGLGRVDAMAVVQVDGGDAEAGEGSIACFADVGRFVADGAGAVGGDVAGEFGGEEDVGAFAGLLEPSGVGLGTG